MEANIRASIIESCSVGKETGSDCHKTVYTRLKKLNDIETTSVTERELLYLRTGIRHDRLINICEHHKVYFLKKYETYQTSCIDPFKRHKKKITKSLRIVNQEFSDELFSKLNIKVIPGQKVCSGCREYIRKLHDNSIEDLDNSIEDLDTCEKVVAGNSDFNTSFEKEAALKNVNTSFEELGVSPLKFHAVPSHSRVSYVKRKIKVVCDTLTSTVQKVVEEELFPEKIGSYDENATKDNKKKADDLDVLVNLIKEKLNITPNQQEKIRLLTLIPVSWSRKKIIEEFKVSDYSVRQSRLLLKEQGILAMPESRKGKTLSSQTIEFVHNYYQNDEYSRLMPGKKDVSIAKNQHVQKRLILCNLKELYAHFKNEYPNADVHFSKFCMLRPKWCVLAGTSGTHAVCVCTIHQNVILLLHATQIEESYHDLISHIVCSTENRDCMLRHCTNCPTSENLKKMLESKFEEYDPTDVIEYSQWVSTDRTELIKCTVTLEEYFITLIEKLEKLTPHSYIAKAQANFLKQTKANLQPHETVVLLDFSQNFSYVIQDEVQGYHWTNNACTVHPAVIYTQLPGSNVLTTDNLCILSDDLDHDVTFVYATQTSIISYIKENFPTVRKVYYFSDGCAGQYKNCKNFLNLCYHEKDFSLQSSWSFFATSHGKSPCDGIGGTVKRLITKESLQRCLQNQICSVEEVFNFCSSRIDNISFRLIQKQSLQNLRAKLSERFSKAKTIPGTRKFHQFTPLSYNTVGIKRISSDAKFTSIFNFDAEKIGFPMSQLSINLYVACVYDDHWFFGIVKKLNHEEEDVTVEFLHPYGPAKCFYWPPTNRQDKCEVPLNNIISIVNVPTTIGTGRMWYFDDKEVAYVQNQFKKHFSS